MTKKNVQCAALSNSLTGRSLQILFAFSLMSSPNAGSGQDFSRTGWNLDDRTLLQQQAAADVEQVVKALDATDWRAARIAERVLADGDARKILMVRFRDGSNEIWTLLRTSQRAFVANVSVDRNHSVGFTPSCGEVNPSDWDALFETFRSQQQRGPTPPLKSGQHMRHGEFWPQGYSGIVNIYDEGKSQVHLLATEDIYRIHFMGPIDELACRTVFAGMHCHTGATVSPGWVQEDLSALLKKGLSSSREPTSNSCKAIFAGAKAP